MNTLGAIIAAMVTALVADHGTFDLSGPDQVKVGTYDQPPTTARPFACVVPPAQTASAPYGTGPDFYLETYRAEVRVWAPVTRGSTEDRAERARLVSAEVVQSLDAARTGDTAIWRCVYWRVVDSTPDPAAATALPGWARGQITIEFTFRRAVGTGV